MKRGQAAPPCTGRTLSAASPPRTSRPTSCVHAGLDGPRPSVDVVNRLRSGLCAENRALGDLRAAREQVRGAVVQARAQGVGYFALAAAVVPAQANLALTTAKRRRMAAALSQRLFEARCRR